MDKYLVVITTVLVLTQVMRLVQNTISLQNQKKYNEEIHKENEKVKKMNEKQIEVTLKADKAIDKYLGEG